MKAMPQSRLKDSGKGDKTAMMNLVRDSAIQENRGRLNYLKRYNRQNRLIKLYDRMSSCLLGSRSSSVIATPKRILLANCGQLGDLVLSTYPLSVIRRAFPNAEIGFLIAEWSRCVIENHPYINFLHVLNPPWASLYRSGISFGKRFRKYCDSAPSIIRDIKGKKYDVAIDMRAWFGNYIHELWIAQIPVRIGFDRIGPGALLTHPISYRYSQRHEALLQSDLLRILPIESQAFRPISFSLPPASDVTIRATKKFLSDLGITGDQFVVIHPGTGGPAARNWPIDHWRELVRRLTKDGHRVLFTGKGAKESSIIDAIEQGNSLRCYNACNRADWATLVEIIRMAAIVYAPETSVGHVAAAVGTPSISIYGGVIDHLVWGPLGDRNIVLTNDIPCSPCFRSEGCAHMECIRGVSAESAFEAGMEMMATAHGVRGC